MSVAKTCPKCGAVAPDDAPHGCCPACLLGRMLPATRVRYFGDYELLGEIARGGMGAVYRARQVSLNRPVALKMILAGHFAGSEQIDRFRREAQAAAQLDHPNIVPIYEVGEHEGQHYYSMRLVEGEGLAERITRSRRQKEAHLESAETQPGIAKLMATVARAVHYAHQHGILHRDLKPANILLDAHGQPHITDFGLAKQLESAGSGTLSGAVLGTPHYMAPEQAAAQSKAITTAADIYSLGAILYELLTDRPPFVGESPVAILRQAAEQPPAHPRAVNPEAHPDLATICLKCLEKEPQRRYGSAEALAQDLERWLEHKPILARPVPDWERALLWARRRPAVASLLAALVLALSGGFAGVVWQWRRAEFHADRAKVKAAAEAAQRLRAEKAFAESEAANVRYQSQRAEDFFLLDDAAAGLAQLARLLRDQPENRSAAERLISALSQRNFPLLVFPPLRNQREVYMARFSADGTRLSTASLDHTAQIWDAATGQKIGPALQHQAGVDDALFSPDGRWVATSSRDGTARLWDAHTGQPRSQPLPHPGRVRMVNFSPDSRWLVSCSDRGPVRLWEVATGAGVTNRLQDYPGVLYAAFSPDSRWLIIGMKNNTAHVLDATTGEPLLPPLLHADWVTLAEFSLDGGKLLTADDEGVFRGWDT